MSKLQENNKEYYFATEIGRRPVTVELSLGWIWIRYEQDGARFFGGPKKQLLSLTSDDALALSEAIQKLVPKPAPAATEGNET